MRELTLGESHQISGGMHPVTAAVGIISTVVAIEIYQTYFNEDNPFHEPFFTTADLLFLLDITLQVIEIVLLDESVNNSYTCYECNW